MPRWEGGENPPQSRYCNRLIAAEATFGRCRREGAAPEMGRKSGYHRKSKFLLPSRFEDGKD